MTLLVLVGLLQIGADAVSVDDFLDELARMRTELRALEARLVMENITPEERVESTGTVLYVRPQRIVFRILTPSGDSVAQVFLVDKSRIYEYDAEIRQLQIYDRDDNREMEALFAAFESDPKILRRQYEIELFEPGDASDRSVQGIMLRHKESEQGGENLFERVRVYLRAGDLLPTRIHIINDADSEAILNLDDLEVNPPIEPYADRIAVPKGVKVIENEERVRTVRKEVEYIPEPAGGEASNESSHAPEAE